MKRLFPRLWVALLGATAVGEASAATVLVTGSDRGLGLEFTKQYAARGDTVIATCRHPDRATELQTLAHDKRNVVVERLDVNDDDEVKALAAKYHSRPI